MYIVMVASECAPVAKAGGLGDVVSGLGRELALRGNEVEIVLPKYDCLRYDHIWDLQVAWHDLWVPWYHGAIHCTVYFGHVHGQRCLFIEPHSPDRFFDRGTHYGFHDDHLRFAFFSKAAMEFLLVSGRQPDIIHSHDWQTAIVPVLLYEIYQPQGMGHPRVCHTIHNFRHQGIVGDDVLYATRLDRPEYYHHDDRLQDDFNPSALNLLRGAIVYANFVTTVSPYHAWEVLYTDQGYGLGHILHRYRAKFGGVINGLDYHTWNPEIDPYIPYHYGAEDIRPKYANKHALRQRLLLSEEYKPIIASIGRLCTQKGVHLIRHALFYALEHHAQFVLLGSASEAGINEEFWYLKHLLNDNPDCHLELGFDEELAHLIYAGADMIVVPSLFEPCGLIQMIALRYGTVPVVRAVGGLVDTVFDHDYAPRPPSQRNGYVFEHFDIQGIESALHRALGLWNHHPEAFLDLVHNGMRQDFSWRQPAQDYLNIYEHIRDNSALSM